MCLKFSQTNPTLFTLNITYESLEPGVSLEAASLFLRGRGKAVYISPSSDPTLVLLLVGHTEYDDDDDDDNLRISS
ncbi:hypothetical protein Hanom_Chr14g01294371 [Helianthus anomalus]